MVPFWHENCKTPMARGLQGNYPLDPSTGAVVLVLYPTILGLRLRSSGTRSRCPLMLEFDLVLCERSEKKGWVKRFLGHS